MTSRTCILVFTRDLRLSDNKALKVASDNFEFVIPLFVFDDSSTDGLSSSGNRIAYLCESLVVLKQNLNNISSELYVRHGDWHDEVTKIAEQTRSSGVVWTKDTDIYGISRDEKMQNYCRERGLYCNFENGHSVVDPETIWPKAARVPREFKVFTPYYNKWLESDFGQLISKPKELPLSSDLKTTLLVGEIPDPDKFTNEYFSPNREIGGEKEARIRLNKWAKNDLANYEANHNDLEADKTSHISSALHFGTLSAREVILKLHGNPGAIPFIRQLCWRDFYNQILFYNPDSFNKDYVNRNDTWNVDDFAFEKWCNGETGYPVVDAAMRQLKLEGFMHNRARMIVASFLTKDLYINWKLGADWFMKWLTDADIANNYLNWQWVAGTGTDTNPNRIFNPIRQSERFDKDGVYIRRYIPELRAVDTKDIHFPHHLRDQIGGSTLLGDYPEPIVDHKEAITNYKIIKLNNKLNT